MPYSTTKKITPQQECYSNSSINILLITVLIQTNYAAILINESNPNIYVSFAFKVLYPPFFPSNFYFNALRTMYSRMSDNFTTSQTVPIGNDFAFFQGNYLIFTHFPTLNRLRYILLLMLNEQRISTMHHKILILSIFKIHTGM